MARYDRRKSPTPSYLGCIFTLAARCASVDLRVEYVNERDTCARRSKLCRLRKAYVRRKFTPHKAGVSHVKVWAREQRRISRLLRKSYVNGAGRRLRSRRKH